MFRFEELELNVKGKTVPILWDGSFDLDEDGVIESITTGELTMHRRRHPTVEECVLFQLLAKAIEADQRHADIISDHIARKLERAETAAHERMLRDARE